MTVPLDELRDIAADLAENPRTFDTCDRGECLYPTLALIVPMLPALLDCADVLADIAAHKDNAYPAAHTAPPLFAWYDRADAALAALRGAA